MPGSNRKTATETEPTAKSTGIHLHNHLVCVVASNAARRVVGARQKGDAMNRASDARSAHGPRGLIVLLAQHTPRTCRPACPDAGREFPRFVRGEGSAFRFLRSPVASARSPRSCAPKGCQSLQGLFHRKSLKTRIPPSKRVSRICVEILSFGSLSTRQCVPSRIRRNSQKTNDPRPRYSTVNRGPFRPPQVTHKTRSSR